MKYFLYLFTLLSLFACTNETNTTDVHESEHETTNAVKKINPEYTVLTVQNSTSDWGYQLLKDGQLMIDQKHIPAIQGNRGFTTKEDAEKVANFILEKIKKGEFPPTVSVEELDSLGVL
jgi:hypothetical protein